MSGRWLQFLVVVGLVLGFAGPVPAAIYKWVDENGVVSYQDTPPPGVPAQVVNPDAAYRPDPDHPVRIETESPSVPAPARAEARRSVPKVEIYVTSWCGYCRKAKNFFASRNIPFTAYDIEKDRAAAQRKAQLSPGGGVPVTVIDGRVFRGYSESAYAAALGARR